MLSKIRLSYWLLLVFGVGVVASCTNILGIDTEYEDNPCTTGEKLPPLQCGEGACRTFIDACDAKGLPVAECAPGNPQPSDTCGDGLDNDCDGSVDEDDSGDCKCGLVGEAVQKPCYTGAPSTRKVGLCRDGIQSCVNSTWGQCIGDVLPVIEKLDGFDNDCDGEIDEGIPCDKEGEQQYCYGGPVEDPTTPPPNPCKGGTQTCLNGQWGKCIGHVLPVIEICDDVDNDCDGNTDDLGEVGSPCFCATGQKEPCYFDEAGNETDCPPDLKGICTCGTRTCTNGQFGTCKDAIIKSPNDVCDGANDDDCNGIIDNVAPGSLCACLHGTEESCYEGPVGTVGIGTCLPGTRSCINGQWKTCTGQKLPSVEICDGLDNDCNGQDDDGVTGVGDVCFLPQYAGTPCHGGTKKCEIGDSTPKCKPNVEPFTLMEDCDAIDDDCNGVVDDGSFCCTANNDNEQNGNETDINCGGSCSTKCAAGKKCKVGIDCESGNCVGNTCISPTCTDMFKNGFETDVDCGIVCPNKCLVGQGCGQNGDCVSDLCDLATKVCTQKPIGASCGKAAECASGNCVDGVCCNEVCNGVCEACTNALKGGGQNGFCGSVADNTDPDNDCATNLPATCGSTGICVGGTCAQYSAGTVCQNATCTGPATENQADICDGNGACLDKVEKDCTPYACVGNGCKTSCVVDGECASGYYCNSPQCQLKKPIGQSCTLGSQCQTGNCIDTVCCDATCAGTCLACNLAGMLGTCTNIPAGLDPANECNQGQCDGLGECQRANGFSCTVNGQCASGNCVDNVCCNTPCVGTCVACDIAGSLGTCTNIPANQDPANECPNGACDGQAQCQGVTSQPCTTPSGCANNLCVDGFCCDTPCNGACEACSALLKGSGADGICGPVSANSDPADECPLGECNGAKACEVADGTTCTANSQCVSGFCVDGFCCDTLCNGLCEACSTAIKGSGSNGVCAPIDANSDPASECPTGECNGAKACESPQGAPCSLNSQCETAYCVDGVCCNSPCAGSCQGCTTAIKGAGVNGVCGSIVGGTDPENECLAQAASTCAETGFCNGMGACALHPNGTVCLPQSCNGAIRNNPDTCNGLGQCQDNGTQSCLPFTCNGGDCLTMCASDTDCAMGNYCDTAGTTCATKKMNGLACAGANQCQSGFCVDGFCCENSCTGECKSCGLAGTLGFCANIPSGQTDSSPSCQGVQICNGAGTCVDANGQPCASNGECFSTLCVDGFCCNSPCTATCQACSQALTGSANGVCSPITNGLDPQSECPGGAACDGAGMCGLLGLGTPCANGSECGTGHCYDGVCCDVACTGICEACVSIKTGGMSGLCLDVTPGTDPDNECAATLSCAPGGQCQKVNGAICSADSECQSGACVDGVCCNSACNGNCQACNNAGSVGSCTAVPAGSQDTCAIGSLCDATGACKKVQGQTCAVGTECLTGFCADGLCCNMACSGTCQACSFVKTGAMDGTCGNVTINTDPDSECTGTDVCNGAGVCKKVQGAACGGASECLNNTCVDGFCCNDTCTGLCRSCSGALTGGLDGTCNNVSGGTDPGNECAGLGVCDGTGACIKGPGDTCMSGMECQSGFCVDNVCCNNACTGLCQGCTVALTGVASGTCSPLIGGTDPVNECPTGDCNGAGACELPNGSMCTLASECESGFCVDGFCCDATCNGTCVACNLMAAQGTCTSVPVDTDPGNECSPGDCNGMGACELPDGAGCTQDSQCGNGSCVDGVCCNTTCTGLCEACNLAGTIGTCTAIPFGSDPANECMLLACNGQGACQLLQGAMCNTSQECGTALCVDGFCCDTTCDATCESCNQIAAQGTCTANAADTDPEGECTTECNGAGACEAVNGTACGSDPNLCQSGFCVDSVCCENDCTGTCQTCNGTGTCVNIGSNLDPNSECPTGDCSGFGACEVADGQPCPNGNADCESGSCVSMTCAAPTCTDGIKNGAETDVDCGGGTCPDCALLIFGGDSNRMMTASLAVDTAMPWSVSVVTNSAKTDRAVSLAMIRSNLVVGLIKDTTASSELRYLTWTPAGWSAVGDVDGNTGVANAINAPPSLGVSAGIAHAAYRKGDNIHYAQFNGTMWSSLNELARTITGAPAVVAPAVSALSDGTALLLLVESQDLVVRTRGGSPWSTNLTLHSNVEEDTTPAMIRLTNGDIMVAYVAANGGNQIYVRLRKGTDWNATATFTVPSGLRVAGSQIALAPLPNGKAILVYKNATATDQNKPFFTTFNGTMFNMVSGQDDMIWTTPAKAADMAMNNSLSVARGMGGKVAELAFISGNKVQHTRYDGTTWSTPVELDAAASFTSVSIAAPPP